MKWTLGSTVNASAENSQASVAKACRDGTGCDVDESPAIIITDIAPTKKSSIRLP